MYIPPTRSAAWALPGIRDYEKQPITLSEAQINAFISKVHQAYNLPEGTIFGKWEGTNRPKRTANAVNLCDIRKAIVIRLKDETAASFKNIAIYLQLERTSPRQIYQYGKTYIKTKNTAFMAVYETVKQIPFE